MAFGEEYIFKTCDDTNCVPGSFRRKNLRPGLAQILAKRGKGYEPVSYAFNKAYFTRGEAAQWLEDHEVGIEIEKNYVPGEDPAREETLEKPREMGDPVWISIVRQDLENFQADTIWGRAYSEGVMILMGDLKDGSQKNVTWAYCFDDGFTEQEARDWLTSNRIMADVQPVDELDDKEKALLHTE